MSPNGVTTMLVAVAAITSGTITASPCTVEPSSASQTVTFPSVTDVQLKQLADASGTASTFPNQTFNILLTGCDSGISNVLVSFSGLSDTGIAADKTVLKNSGSASNVGVRIMDSAGTTALKFDGSNSLTFPITSVQDNALSFNVSLIANPSTVVTAGTVAAIASATITYN